MKFQLERIQTSQSESTTINERVEYGFCNLSPLILIMIDRIKKQTKNYRRVHEALLLIHQLTQAVIKHLLDLESIIIALSHHIELSEIS